MWLNLWNCNCICQVKFSYQYDQLSQFTWSIQKCYVTNIKCVSKSVHQWFADKATYWAVLGQLKKWKVYRFRWASGSLLIIICEQPFNWALVQSLCLALRTSRMKWSQNLFLSSQCFFLAQLIFTKNLWKQTNYPLFSRPEYGDTGWWCGLKMISSASGLH